MPNFAIPTKIEPLSVRDELPLLRNEILESEKAKTEYLKYKLIAVAALGSVGLGFGDKSSGQGAIDTDYLLLMIPWVCAYVDLLCYHNIVRILVIAKYLYDNDDPYERHVFLLCKKVDKANNRKGMRYLFQMEDLPLHWSSIVLSVLIVFYSIVIFLLICLYIHSRVIRIGPKRQFLWRLGFCR